jgi:hypothetical protein
MSNQTQARQAASYFIRQRQRSRQFALALTKHSAGLAVTGADAFDGKLTSGAMFVQDANGSPWVALTSGTTGSTPLTGNGVVNDGGVTWQFWAGKILSAPPTPAA